MLCCLHLHAGLDKLAAQKRAEEERTGDPSAVHGRSGNPAPCRQNSIHACMHPCVLEPMQLQIMPNHAYLGTCMHMPLRSCAPVFLSSSIPGTLQARGCGSRRTMMMRPPPQQVAAEGAPTTPILLPATLMRAARGQQLGRRRRSGGSGASVWRRRHTRVGEGEG